MPPIVDRAPLDALDPSLALDRPRLARRFASAEPYQSLVLEDFLAPDALRAVGRDLARAIDDRFLEGRDGQSGIAICRKVSTIGPGFARLDAFLGSGPWLDWLREVTGVRRLLRNPASDCGGFFRFGEDSEMDVHLDSNDVDVHCAQTGHRRKINLLLYLSRGWEAAWGGWFELYRDPSRPPVKAFAPLFNRAILFDAHDGAWHGVTRVQLPEGKRHLSRLVLIVNYYSTERAGSRPAPPHHNIWMPRPLPPHIRPGHRTTAADVLEVFRLLRRRDGRLRGLLKLEEDCRALGSGRGGADAPPPAPVRDPFGALEELTPGLRPGRVLSRRDVAALRSAFAGKDRELRRLYGRQHAYVERLKARAPHLVPKGY